MIIVEGPDGAGKTTLIARLEKQLGLTREPRAVSAGAEKMKPIGQYVEDELEKGFGMRLYDRFALISSPMYLSLPNPTFSEEMLDLIWLASAWRKFRQVDPVIVLCLPEFATVKANVAKDESSKVMWEYWETIYWNYHNWLAVNLQNTSILHYNYTLTGSPQALQEQRLQGLIRWAQARVEKGR